MKGPWGVARVPSSPGLRGSEGCCGLNAREAASGLLVESGRHFDRYMDKFGLSLLSPPLTHSCHGTLVCTVVYYHYSLLLSLRRRILARRTVSTSDKKLALLFDP